MIAAFVAMGIAWVSLSCNVFLTSYFILKKSVSSCSATTCYFPLVFKNIDVHFFPIQDNDLAQKVWIYAWVIGAFSIFMSAILYWIKPIDTVNQSSFRQEVLLLFFGVTLYVIIMIFSIIIFDQSTVFWTYLLISSGIIFLWSYLGNCLMLLTRKSMARLHVFEYATLQFHYTHIWCVVVGSCCTIFLLLLLMTYGVTDTCQSLWQCWQQFSNNPEFNVIKGIQLSLILLPLSIFMLLCFQLQTIYTIWRDSDAWHTLILSLLWFFCIGIGMVAIIILSFISNNETVLSTVFTSGAMTVVLSVTMLRYMKKSNARDALLLPKS